MDYVVVGETGNDSIYNYSQLKKAINYLNPTRTPNFDSSHVPASSTDSIDKLFSNSPRLAPSSMTGLGGEVVMKRPKFIATNCDTVDRALPYGWSPSVGSLVASIEVATGLKAYYLGKPNPLMMTSALSKLGGLRSDTVIIGDRMDTDIIGGIEAGIETILVLSGVTVLSDLDKFPFRPSYILGGVNELGQIIYASTPSRRLDLFSEFSPPRI